MKTKNFVLIITIAATFSICPTVVKASNVNKAIQKEFLNKNLTRTSQWQNTSGFSRPDGIIDTSLYSVTDINKLSDIVSKDDKFHGNVFYGKVGSDRKLVQPGTSGDIPIPTFLGDDGVLQISNQSNYITNENLQAAVTYWNKLAGTTIIECVTDPAKSDEIIHDVNKDDTSADVLMAQTYDGNGIICCPENFNQGNYTDKEYNNEMSALLIHELGHALGISHMGGGNSGDNAAGTGGNVAYWSEDFMSTWTPYHNPEGVTSTRIDAAALAIVGMAWKKPRQVAAWALKFDDSSLTIDNFNILPDTNTIPKGISVNDPFNLIKEDCSIKQVAKNYNVYDSKGIDKSFADKEKYGKVTYLNTTLSLGLIGKSIYIEKDYTAHNGIHIYRVKTSDNQDYIINAGAFASVKADFTLPDWGVQVDSQVIQDADQHYETVTQNYLVYSEGNLNIPKIMAEDQYYYLNIPISTTQSMNLIGKKLLVLKSYMAKDNIEVNKVLIDGEVYYILKKAFSVTEINNLLYNTKSLKQCPTQ